MTTGPGPLDGIRVVEIATFIAAPAGSHLLASQGAEVIKVEDLAVGDPLRMFGSSRNGMSGWFANLNAGKRSLAMDIASTPGKEVMADLLATADVFVQAYRPGVAERLGIGEADVRERNPDILGSQVLAPGERSRLLHVVIPRADITVDDNWTVGEAYGRTRLGMDPGPHPL